MCINDSIYGVDEALGKLTFDEAAAGGVFKLSRLACALMAAVKSGTAFDEVCDGNHVHGASRTPICD